MFRLLSLSALIPSLLLSSLSGASAQETKVEVKEASASETKTLAPEDAKRAARAFTDASAAANEGRWSDAIAGFGKAYDISKAPTALFNKAMTLRAIGRHKDARDELLLLVQRHSDYSKIDEAKSRYKEEAARVAVLTLTGFDPDPPLYEVRTNGALLDGSGERRVLESDPGPQTVVVERPGYQQFLWEGTLADGERKSLDIVMQKIKTKGIFSSPAFWILTGIVVAGGTAALVYFLDRGAQVKPLSMNVVELPNDD